MRAAMDRLLQNAAGFRYAGTSTSPVPEWNTSKSCFGYWGYLGRQNRWVFSAVFNARKNCANLPSGKKGDSPAAETSGVQEDGMKNSKSVICLLILTISAASYLALAQ